ncbi:AMP deaminase [Beta vulgaris subsp. vulgaris]|uniref:AMP deaminase n=1 Tax=Beta vulgaris subsp. vulgaris TaxID=3555 RepID=UPI002036C800|nr:AMP deaminase [Beta vulgaris subsp. vulgaris]
MDPSPSMVHLAMAAFFGASIMAISALFIHKRSVDQILERLIEVRRKKAVYRADRLVDGELEEEEEHMGHVEDENGVFHDVVVDDNDDDDEIEISGQVWSVQSAGGENMNLNMISSYGISSSVPNVVGFSNDWLEDDSGNRCLSSSLDKSHLPLLQRYLRSGDVCSSKTSTSSKRIASQNINRNASENTIDSNEQDKELQNGDAIHSQENNDTSANADSKLSAQKSSAFPAGYENINSMQDQKSRVAACERKAILDLPANVELDMPSTGGNDFTAESVLPLKAAMPVPLNVEEEEVQRMLRECLELREAYVYREQVAPWNKPLDDTASGAVEDPFHFYPIEKTDHDCRMEDGIIHIYANKDDTEELFPVPSATQFFTDMHQILKVVSSGNVNSACFHRLRFLEEKFRLYLLVNADREFLAQKSAPHRDFYNIRKVDTHIHHSACMNQKHLLRFIKSKLRKEPDEVVIFRDGKYLTLKEVFESLDLTGYDLNVDLLDVHADKTTFHRFDKFNLKYNPCGQSRLREIFLKQDNLIQGRFLAEVTKEVLADLEASKYQMAEYRISIYGRKQSEWDQLASWFINNEIYSENAVWLIQLPRLYNVYKKMGIVTSFQNIIDNVFIPLFEVTVDPNSHPQLHVFLKQVVGFDLVDDESKPERRPTKHMPTPAEWTNEFNPAFAYYTYYCYANLYTLNKLRESKGFRTIKLRPHCGEAGDVDHLAAGFLLCHNISHGINLRKSPVLQYLYYLAQVGLAMSPLSNNSLFLDYHRNPFPMFFQRGLNVSLSSDDPLQIHLTKEALVEEYSVAAQVWKLSACDLCEVARNSVYQSGFSHAAKLHWLGGKYYLRSPEGNDIHKTNVPKLRIAFRHETWKEEMQYVYSGKTKIPEEIDIN